MMFKVSCYRNWFLLALMLLPVAGMQFAAVRPVAAQTQAASSSANFGGFFAPKGKGAPQQSQGGASRGACFGDASSLEHGMNLITLITPDTNRGLSVAARPVLFAHVSPSLARQVYFSLKNDDESYFYEQTVTLTSSGMLRFQLPDDAPELQVGEEYRWSVALICGNRLAPDSPWASAVIERSDALTLETQSMTPMEQASAYGRAGLWYDTVDRLYSMVQSQPASNAQSALSQLLAAEGLDSVSSVLKSSVGTERVGASAAVSGDGQS